MHLNYLAGGYQGLHVNKQKKNKQNMTHMQKYLPLVLVETIYVKGMKPLKFYNQSIRLLLSAKVVDTVCI